MDIEKVCSGLRAGSERLAVMNAAQKNKALEAVVDSINRNKNKILAANSIDVKKARDGTINKLSF